MGQAGGGARPGVLRLGGQGSWEVTAGADGVRVVRVSQGVCLFGLVSGLELRRVRYVQARPLGKGAGREV